MVKIMTDTNATVPAVWVLIFDRCPAANETRVAATTQPVEGLPLSAPTDNAGTFDRLDLQSTCFEQFLLQNVRSDTEAFDVFGGEAALVQLVAAMTVNNQTASLVRLTGSHTDLNEDAAFDAMETSWRRCHVPLNCVVKQDCRSGSETVSEMISQAYSASLVWMEARTALSPDLVVEYDQILNFVFEQLQHQTTQGKRCPVLIVTFRSGDEHFIQQPLSCGIEENRIHVPLWIRPNAGHACRVQALAGSFDLLPTIATFLGSAVASDEARPPDVPLTDRSSDSISRGLSSWANGASVSLSERTFPDAISRQTTEENRGGDKSAAGNESSHVLTGNEKDLIQPSSQDSVEVALASGARSLAFLCGAPQVCPDRLVYLCGDGWKAARTEEFLLVLADPQESRYAQTESDGDSSTELSRRLYVKPEDRFNVNDVSGTYATAADLLAQMIQ